MATSAHLRPRGSTRGFGRRQRQGSATRHLRDEVERIARQRQNLGRERHRQRVPRGGARKGRGASGPLAADRCYIVAGRSHPSPHLRPPASPGRCSDQGWASHPTRLHGASWRSPGFVGGCRKNPRRARWIRSMGGLRRRPSPPSRDGGRLRSRRAQPLWHPLSGACSGISDTTFSDSLVEKRQRGTARNGAADYEANAAQNAVKFARPRDPHRPRRPARRLLRAPNSRPGCAPRGRGAGAPDGSSDPRADRELTLPENQHSGPTVTRVASGARVMLAGLSAVAPGARARGGGKRPARASPLQRAMFPGRRLCLKLYRAAAHIRERAVARG
jgi:hypothetical protein